MQLNVTVQLNPDDTFDLSADDVATRCLQAVGGNPETDECVAFIQLPVESGRTGPSVEPVAAPEET